MINFQITFFPHMSVPFMVEKRLQNNMMRYQDQASNPANKFSPCNPHEIFTSQIGKISFSAVKNSMCHI